MPFVRLHWSNGQRTLESVEDLSVIRIQPKADGPAHQFRLADCQDDAEGFAIGEEVPTGRK